MDAKEILNPQRLMIAVGVLVIVLSFWGIMNGDKWAEYGWGKENVLAHDEDYEKMWALHMMPLGCLLYTSPSPRDRQKSRMPSSA